MTAVVLLGDSLCLPREPEWGDIAYEATYPALLKERFAGSGMELVERGMSYRTMEDVLAHWPAEVEARNAAAVIVHVGIVDCAPRVFLPRERDFVQNLPLWLRRIILGGTNRLRRWIIKFGPDRVYVTYDRFVRALDAVVTRSRGLRKLLFVNIISPTDRMEYRSPGYREKVRRYNQALQSRSGGAIQVVDLDAAIWRNGGPDRLTVDGVHINQAGHRLLFEELEPILRQEVESRPAVNS